jgi:hypothetical protein
VLPATPAAAIATAPIDPADAPQPVVPSATPPPLKPRVLMATGIGGAGDQAITAVGFDQRGHVTAAGAGFSATVDALAGTGVIHGDATAGTALPALPPPPLAPRTISTDGGSLTFATRDAAPLLLPTLESEVWSWWKVTSERALALGLGADARLYDVLPLPQGRFLAVAWSDGANTVLARDPRDPAKPNPTLAQPPSGPATWLVIGALRDGAPVASLALPGPPVACTVDPWGRIYLAAPSAGRDDLGMGGRAGLTVLGSDLSPLFDARLGGLADGEPGIERFTAIAYHDGILALAGTTAARELPAKNPLQAKAGGGQDGLLVVLQLWADTTDR